MILVVVIVLMIASPDPSGIGASYPPEGHVYLEGTAEAGRDWVGDAGWGLELRVVSLGDPGDGWHIELVDPAFPDDDMTSVATPPFRGVNALWILPWHFLNETGDGPNDGSVNAPGEERNFLFVVTREDYLLARDILEMILCRSSTAEMEEAVSLFDSISVYRGTLTIVEMDLRPSTGTLESISFSVELERP